MPFSVVINNEDGTKSVKDIRFQSVDTYDFPFYLVFLGDHELGHVSSTNPSYSGWDACPNKTPDEEERTKLTLELWDLRESGKVDQNEWFKRDEELREMFYRWIGRNLCTRRHAAQHLLRVAGYSKWAP